MAVEIHKNVNQVPTATVTLMDGDLPNAAFPISDMELFKPGAAISVKAGYDNGETLVFEGIVIRHGISISAEETCLKLECKDACIAMTGGRKNANYVDKKDSDIISGLIGAYAGLSADVASTQVAYKELVQYYCTDWDFMLARAEANGLWVTAEGGKVTVSKPAAKGNPVLTVTYGTDMMDFEADMDAQNQAASVEAVAWDLATQKIATGSSAPIAITSQGNVQSSTLAQVTHFAKSVLQSATPMANDALKAWAQAAQVKAGLSRIRGHVRFQGSALATLGSEIELRGVGARFNGRVLATGVSHAIKDGNWTTEVRFGSHAQWFTERHQVAASPASGWTAGIEGLHVGIVMKRDGDPESQNRIQVSIPLMQAATEGVWARMGHLYGSNGCGYFFLPETGDEVILGFFNNDPSHPVILGSLYSSKNKAPMEATAENNVKAIVTKSKLSLEFDDQKKSLTLVTPGKNTVVLDDDGKSILLKDQSGNSVKLSQAGIEMDSQKDISIKAAGKITLDAKGALSVNSAADVKVEGMNVNLSAQVGFVGKGSATAELSASGQTTVKGAMVMIN
jgi:Rhs element Vgr protein